MHSPEILHLQFLMNIKLGISFLEIKNECNSNFLKNSPTPLTIILFMRRHNKKTSNMNHLKNNELSNSSYPIKQHHCVIA